MSREIFFCVDIEASGPVPALYNMVSIGALAVSKREHRWVPEEERFYIELKPMAAGFDPGAMKVHGITREHLEAHGVAPDEAMRRLAAFVEERLRKTGGRAVFVGHNAAFDWSYISWYYERFSIPNPFGYKALDSKSLAMGRLGIGWSETNKERLEELLYLPPQDKSQTHRADYDAYYQALILCGLLNRKIVASLTPPPLRTRPGGRRGPT
ncbi:MAG TPA: 3'-5' exonuclease [Candidatus Polarisedimenticolia bacterium]|nr:3'-5' exonuclease [Candidatus Polarisedimenticolia bacterium]